MAIRQYRGVTIYPVQSLDLARQGIRWTVEAQHHTGMDYDESCRPAARSLADARAIIRQRQQDARADV